MPSIKNKMNEVYKDHHFTQKKQQETLNKLRRTNDKQAFSWKPLLSSLTIVCIILLLLLTSAKEPIVETTSSEIAPYAADEALLERVHQFQSVLADGTITDQERRQYISTSDWDLQLAFETGTSIFYNRPAMTEHQVQAVTELLHNMYYMVYDNVPISNIDFIDKHTTFTDFMEVVASYNEQVEQVIEEPYVSSLTEKPFTKNKFLNIDWWWQLALLALFTLFIYLLVQNIRTKRKWFIGVCQCIIIAVLASFFFVEDQTMHSYNETALMESAIKNAKETNANYEITRLINIAQFPEGRVALFELADGSIKTMEFLQYGDSYKYYGGGWGKTNLYSGFSHSRYDEHTGLFVVQEDSKVAQYSVVESKTRQRIAIDKHPRTNIQWFIYPAHMTNNEIYFLDADGNEILN